MFISNRIVSQQLEAAASFSSSQPRRTALQRWGGLYNRCLARYLRAIDDQNISALEFWTVKIDNLLNRLMFRKNSEGPLVAALHVFRGYLYYKTHQQLGMLGKEYEYSHKYFGQYAERIYYQESGLTRLLVGQVSPGEFYTYIEDFGNLHLADTGDGELSVFDLPMIYKACRFVLEHIPTNERSSVLEEFVARYS